MIPIETNYVVYSRHNSQVIRYRNNTYEISLLKKNTPWFEDIWQSIVSPSQRIL